MRKNRRATRRGQAKAIDKVKEDNAPVAPTTYRKVCQATAGVRVCRCVCVCDLKGIRHTHRLGI